MPLRKPVEGTSYCGVSVWVPAFRVTVTSYGSSSTVWTPTRNGRISGGRPAPLDAGGAVVAGAVIALPLCGVRSPGIAQRRHKRTRKVALATFASQVGKIC